MSRVIVNRLLITVALLFLLSFVTACQRPDMRSTNATTRLTDQPTEPTTEATEEVVQPMNIQSFFYRHRGMSIPEHYEFDVKRTEGGVILHIDFGIGHIVIDEQADDQLIEDLEAMLMKHRVDRWDGFSGTNEAVFDGEGFTLWIELTDGRTISASGDNSFPKGYFAFECDLNDRFMPMIDARDH